MKKLNHLFVCGLLLGSAAFAAPRATSGAPSGTAAAPYGANMTGTGDYSIATGQTRFALGYETPALNNPVWSGGASSAIGLIHALIGFTPNFWLGLGFGFNHNFDAFMISPDLRLNMVVRGPAALFAELKTGYIKANATDDFIVGLLFGFGYGLTENLRVSLAYGLQVGLGDAFKAGDSSSSVATTSNSYTGNFGIHWYF